MHHSAAIAEGILACKVLTPRYLAGFNDTNHTMQAPSLPNHAAWTLGHCAMYMNRVAERLDGKPMPEQDFIVGDMTRPPADPLTPRGDARRFHTESVAFGSKPSAEPGRYPPLARCVEIYNGACDRLAAAVRAAADETLDKPTRWGQTDLPMYLVCFRMIYHNGFHTGQIADLRRALGFKSILS